MLLLHAWWGLNDDVRAYATRLREAGLTVATPDLYGGKVADTIAGAESLRDALERDERGIDDARGMIDDAASQLEGPYAIVSFSLGVYYMWDLTARRPGAVAALVAYYGDNGGEFPERIPPVLGHFAEDDEFEPRPVIDELETALRGRGVDVTHHHYPGTHHWFAEPSRPEYDAQAAELAWQRTLGLLQRTLR